MARSSSPVPAILTLLCLVALASLSAADCGFGCGFKLDPAFGLKTLQISPGRNSGYALIYHQDALYITGPTYTQTVTGIDYYLLKVAYNNGVPVATFGNNGVVITDFGYVNGSRTDVATCLTVYNNNVVVGGESVIGLVNGTSNLAFTFAMYAQNNGNLVPSFGNGGLQTIKISPTGLNDEAFAITVVQNYIYAAGFSNPGTTQGAGPQFDGGVVKLNGNGQLVTNWGEGGKVIIDTLSSDERYNGIHVDLKGRAKITGRIRPLNVPEFQPVVVKLDSDGSYDRSVVNSFFGPGFGVSNQGDNFVTANSIDDEKGNDRGVILAGEWNGWDKSASGRYAAAIVRFQDDGKLDTNWGDYGLSYVTSNNGTLDVYSICRGGRYAYVVGSWTLTGQIRPFIARFFIETGLVDKDFGSNGIFFQPLNSNGFYRDCVVVYNAVYVSGEIGPSGSSAVLYAKYLL